MLERVWCHVFAGAFLQQRFCLSVLVGAFCLELFCWTFLAGAFYLEHCCWCCDVGRFGFAGMYLLLLFWAFFWEVFVTQFSFCWHRAGLLFWCEGYRAVIFLFVRGSICCWLGNVLLPLFSLCLPMGFSRWVSAFGFCCWAFGGRLRFLSAAKICQELLGAAIARMRLGDVGENGRGSVC